MTTKGEYCVRVKFNPSQNSLVDRIKRASAGPIDLINTVPATMRDEGPRGPEVLRLRALAQTAIEDGAMWAVKAATKE